MPDIGPSFAEIAQCIAVVTGMSVEDISRSFGAFLQRLIGDGHAIDAIPLADLPADLDIPRLRDQVRDEVERLMSSTMY